MKRKVYFFRCVGCHRRKPVARECKLKPGYCATCGGARLGQGMGDQIQGDAA